MRGPKWFSYVHVSPPKELLTTLRLEPYLGFISFETMTSTTASGAVDTAGGAGRGGGLISLTGTDDPSDSPLPEVTVIPPVKTQPA